MLLLLLLARIKGWDALEYLARIHAEVFSYLGQPCQGTLRGCPPDCGAMVQFGETLSSLTQLEPSRMYPQEGIKERGHVESASNKNLHFNK